MIRNDDKIKSRNTVLGRGSVNSIRDGARGRMGTGTSSGTPGKNDRKNVKDFELRGVGEEKDADGYKSDDTADMSAIPRDQNNQNESLGSAASMDFNQNEIGENIYDSNAFLSDSDVDRASEKKKESSGKKGRRDSRSGSRSNVKPNRRVSFGEGTKEHLEEEEENEEEAGGEEENDGLSANGSFTVVFDGDNNGTDDNMESSGLGSRRSSVAATPVSRSRAGSSSGGKYSMGETPGSNEFTR